MAPRLWEPEVAVGTVEVVGVVIDTRKAVA